MIDYFNGNYNDCYLIDFSNTENAKQLKPLTAHEVSEIIKSNDSIYQLHFYDRRIIEVFMNYEDLLEKLEFYTSKISQLEPYDIIEKELAEDMYIDVNRVFTNFLSSMVNFVNDSALKRFKRGSPKHDAFTKITNEAYDKYFSYRFFYTLRNYALHYDFPIGHFKKTTLRQVYTGRLKSVLEINFIRDSFKNGSTFKAPLLSELMRDFNETFPVLNQIENIAKPLQEIINGFISLEKDDFETHAEVIMKYANLTPNKYKVAVGKMLPTGYWDTIILPCHIIDRLNERVLHLDLK
ncbi:MAG: hypothetical protein JSS76_18480 [Bacteroidetes bacterium]|nr:hypothetical protein [Bacteroidota bacterium]